MHLYFLHQIFNKNSNLTRLQVPIQNLNACIKDRSKLQRKRNYIEIKLYFSQKTFNLFYIPCVELLQGHSLIHFFNAFSLSPSCPNSFKNCRSELPSEVQSVSNPEPDSTLQFSNRFTSKISLSPLKGYWEHFAWQGINPQTVK